MKKTLKKGLSIWVPLIIGIVFVVYQYNQFSDEDLKQIKKSFLSANYLYIFLSIVLGFIGSYARSYRWKYTIEHLGYSSSKINLFFAVNVSYLMNMLVPRSGEISRSLVLKKYEDIPFDKSFGTIIAERIIDLVLLGLMMLVVFFLQFDIVKTFVLDYIPKEKLIILTGVGAIGFLLLGWVYLYSKIPFVIRLKEKLQGLKEGIMSVVYMDKKIPFLSYTLLIWASYLMMFWVASFTFPETSGLEFEAVITTFVVGSIAIAFTNNGLGSYPVLVAEILLFYGVAKTTGAAFGWIVWISQTLLTLLLGSISLLLLPLFNRK